MAVADIDFEGTNVQENNTGINPDSNVPTNKEEEVTNLGGNDVDDITNSESNNQENNNNSNDDNGNNDDNSSTGELNVGDQLEVDGITYTVAKNGDLVDDKGNVFKESKDVAEWLKSVNVEDENTASFDINSLNEELGVNITDEEGNNVVFDNTVDGVKSYIKSVIDVKSKEIQDATINRFYNDNPLVRQFVDYVQLTGTARGFGEIPDRSSITIDENNEAQQIAVIKMAANEFGNKTINDNYINWLRDNGNLYSYAKEQLNALIDKDKEYRENIEKQAKLQREEQSKEIAAYWNKVNGIITSKMIGGYKLPDNFTREVNGKKVLCNTNDFFNYVSNASHKDEQGNSITGYQKDLQNLTDDEYMNRELLDAWLMFTGGTYKDLIDMAVKEEQVRKLVVRSKENRSAKSVKVVRKQNGKASIDDIIF